MIELDTFSDGKSRLYNPAHIVETGTYSRVPPEGGAAQEVAYVVMSGGYDPVDVRQSPVDIAYLMACWNRRGAACLGETVLFCRLIQTGERRDVEYVVAEG